MVEGSEPEYEVEKVIDSRKAKGGVRYKVKWKGYGPHEMTWEPLTNLTNARETVEEFHMKFPHKPGRPIHRLEIPISLFPMNLLRRMPDAMTEPTMRSIPSEALLHQLVMDPTISH